MTSTLHTVIKSLQSVDPHIWNTVLSRLMFFPLVTFEEWETFVLSEPRWDFAVSSVWLNANPRTKRTSAPNECNTCFLNIRIKLEKRLIVLIVGIFYSSSWSYVEQVHNKALKKINFLLSNIIYSPLKWYANNTCLLNKILSHSVDCDQ